MHRMVRTFVARQLDGTVTLETDADQGDAMRWVFSDMTENTFIWRNSIHRGGRWMLQQDFIANRMQPD